MKVGEPTSAPRRSSTSRTERPQPSLHLVKTGSTTSTSRSGTSGDRAAVSGESRGATSSDAKVRSSAASSRSQDAVGTPQSATETHATGIDEAEAPTGEDGQPVAETAPHPASDEVSTALQSGASGTLTNGNGQQVDFQVTKGETNDDQTSYSVTVGDNKFTVNIPPGEDANDVIARVTDYYSQQPENVQGAVNTFNIEAGANPQDAYWAEKYGMPNFVSAATGGGGTINFWNGSKYLQEGVFQHEFGHNVGSAVRAEQNSEAGLVGGLINAVKDIYTGDNQSSTIPRGYTQAAAADGKSISDYGDQAISEDFAETWSAYQDAVQTGPLAVALFARQYPERYAVIAQQVLTRDLDVAA